MMTVPLKIDIWSDVQCPWCYIGKRKFERGVELFGQPVEIEYHSFELAPDTPVDFAGTTLDYLADRKGLSLEHVTKMLGNVTAIAAEVGLTYDFDSVHQTNTRKAQEAAEMGAAVPLPAVEAAEADAAVPLAVEEAALEEVPLVAEQPSEEDAAVPRAVKEAAEELGSSHEAARRPAPPRPCRTRLACRACAPAGCNATRRLVCALQAACSGGARATQIHLVLHETVRWKAEGWDR
jgi:hypothetical protein